MSKPSETGPPEALAPFYWEDWPNEVVVLEGPLRVKRSGISHDVDGYVAMRWQPSPGLYMHVWSRESGGVPEAIDVLLPDPLPELIPEVAQVPPPPADIVKEPPPAHGAARIGLSEYEVGPGGALARAVFNVINFDPVLGSSAYASSGGGWHRGRLLLAGGPWQCIIDGRSDAALALQTLRETGTFAFTHVGEITRADRAAFAADDVKELLEALWLFLSFARAALVGVALPVGFNADGRAVWARWGVTRVDAWAGGMGWADRNHAEHLENAWSLWWTKRQDPYWRVVLRRAVLYYCEAVRPRTIEQRLVMAQAALELLAWSVLVETEHVVAAEKARDWRAAKRLRRLLSWAGISPTVPVELPLLAGRSRTDGHDGPHYVTDARNEFIHPKHAGPSYSDDELRELQLLAARYVELVLLRIIDYRGTHSNRLTARWVGDVENVPWI